MNTYGTLKITPLNIYINIYVEGPIGENISEILNKHLMH